MDDYNENDVSNTDDNTGVETVEYAVEGQEKPLLKDKKTGKFIKGTGHSGKGGRKPGSKDRVSQAMVDLATELVANRGRELFHEMADRDPAQALALVSKIISPEELRAVYAQDRAEEKNQPQEVNIRLVSSPSPRLPDARSEAEIQDRQRGLTSPVERLPEPTQDDLRDVIEAQVDAPTEPSESAQERADREAAEARRIELERQRALNESIRAHGGRVGAPSRAERAGNGIEYPDDPGVI